MFLLLLTISGAVNNVNAQVTIGAADTPHPGAVLDLRTTAGAKGLLLPKVSISDANVFQLDGSAAQAVGMTVYNTNAGITNGKGVGVYVWDGSNWKVSVGTPGGSGDVVVLDSVKGSVGTYRTLCFPDHPEIGCWMIDNSREGTSSGHGPTYAANGELGYYYTYTQATTACPAGWSLPSASDWLLLSNYMKIGVATTAELYAFLGPSSWAGYATTPGVTYSTSSQFLARWWGAGNASAWADGTRFIAITSATPSNAIYTVRCVLHK